MASADEGTATGRRARGTAAQRLINDHLVSGTPEAGEEIGLRVDQTLTQDATGTLVMQELEALGLDRARTEVSVQYVDHNLLQADERNAEDHLFLRSAAPPLRAVVLQAGQRRLASRPHAAVRQSRARRWRLGLATRCAAGSLGMLAIGVGGLEVALAMAGRAAAHDDAADLGRAADR